ncbi:hypothetical protein F5J12DRAFT_783921 [Pisolithus orientalis]|uniref:uncharacterized protein n=1 Tax=Pisolithus orientalis TaxID=936130 RepID=UPI002224EBCD|nr:uncharacterized protein F5J12DRAFT_783921 [Pisolithus orientalis]KAI6002463.1 hypothetical protein F5J12DRAFT_783921 [Pisolithus orientalis]
MFVRSPLNVIHSSSVNLYSNPIVLPESESFPAKIAGSARRMTLHGKNETRLKIVAPPPGGSPVEWLDGLYAEEEFHNYGIQHSNVLEDFVLRRHVAQIMGRAGVNTNLEMHVLPQGRLRTCRFDYKSISLFLSLAVPSVHAQGLHSDVPPVTPEADNNANGKVVPRSSQSFSDDALLLWEKIAVGRKGLFFNRLSYMNCIMPLEKILAEELSAWNIVHDVKPLDSIFVHYIDVAELTA